VHLPVHWAPPLRMLQLLLVLDSLLSSIECLSGKTKQGTNLSQQRVPGMTSPLVRSVTHHAKALSLRMW
jgi:hypothetical protein